MHLTLWNHKTSIIQFWAPRCKQESTTQSWFKSPLCQLLKLNKCYQIWDVIWIIILCWNRRMMALFKRTWDPFKIWIKVLTTSNSRLKLCFRNAWLDQGKETIRRSTEDKYKKLILKTFKFLASQIQLVSNLFQISRNQ